ncbi:3-oxoacyl-ACP synthase [Aphanothece hegewaldii CCALA 016]|uniref:3-oxoacyl-ACP synthase n=1 Tax=Aphanothece hegewaldii CCALA 016 TaxID=2107694 RepID=A0A2T1LYE2_9CHRO|nr:beta-ketoacyl-ACP synthase [Aphanothece hegewaldii]PSF37415.1 3-oxoacyl-ACP synthase [Aphanothece hegewaldii CCALA 016]
MNVDDKTIVVTGIALQSCLGNLSQTWHSLIQGKSGIKKLKPFCNIPAFPMGLIQDKPLQLPTLTQILLKMALEDALLVPPLPDCGVVIGSSRGCQGIIETIALSKNTENWLDSLPHYAATTIAHLIETLAPVLSPMAACTTGIWAIAQGIELILQGKCDRAIVGAIETPITPLTLTGFSQMGALAETGCYPFDEKREGLVLGEGGAILVLETAELAAQRKAKIYGKVLGFGLTCDAYHMSAPAKDLKSGIIAVKDCLFRSQLNTEDIDYIHTHGTSTQLNDDREAKIINTLFSPSVAISSTKGATGHTLGASGALGVAFCLMALKTGILPPCVGLNRPAYKMNFVNSSCKNNPKYALCLSFGFGGQNGVIAVGKV